MEAESAMKPIENHLARNDKLGASWREKKYKEVGMVIWKNTDGSHDVFIRGNSVDQKLKDALEDVKFRDDDIFRFHY